MNIDYTVTALMFPAIPLMMAVYSNRFHSLSILIRQLHDEHVYEKHIPPEWKKQFINLSALVEICISLIKNIIEIIIDKQHEPKITRAKKSSSK